MKKFNKGTKMFWKSSGLPAYEKLDDEDFGFWVSLCSYDIEEYLEEEVPVEVENIETPAETYFGEPEMEDGMEVVKEVKKEKKQKQLKKPTGPVIVKKYKSVPQSEKPMYRANGEINWFGFRLNDELVFKSYNSIMNFE